MTIAYLDCRSGVSGDMFVGALIDAGLTLGKINEALAGLPIEAEVAAERTGRAGFAATKFSVRAESSAGRSFEEIRALLEEGSLAEAVKNKAIHIFTRLAAAEARVHGGKPEDVHFHEVGAVDSIIDVVSAAVGVESLKLSAISASPLGLGRAAAATIELVKGVPVFGATADHELTTPTGAAIVTSLAASFGAMPAMKVTRTGAGAGDREFDWPNVTRVAIGEDAPGSNDQAVLIETNIDNLNPQVCQYVMDQLFRDGALDVWLTPVQMKKDRPGLKLSCLAKPGDEEPLVRRIFSETDTLGLRINRTDRLIADRRLHEVKTKYGLLPVKVGTFGDSIASVAPEYEACRRLAEEKGVPIKTVLDEARAAAHRELKG